MMYADMVYCNERQFSWFVYNWNVVAFPYWHMQTRGGESRPTTVTQVAQTLPKRLLIHIVCKCG